MKLLDLQKIVKPLSIQPQLQVKDSQLNSEISQKIQITQHHKLQAPQLLKIETRFHNSIN